MQMQNQPVNRYFINRKQLIGRSDQGIEFVE